MRETLSKRTKSLSASPSATPKRSQKTGSRTSAKASPRQRLTVKAVSQKTSVKAAPAQKKSSLGKKKAIAKKAKKVAAQPLRATTSKKAPPKAVIKNVKPVAKPAKSKVKARVSAKPVPKPIVQPVSHPPKTPRRQMATQALRAFERAIKAFNLRQFSEAKAMFEELQQRYHQEVEIASRSQTYIQVCNVRLASNRSLPRNAEEFYDRGVVALNIGNFVQARTFFEKALKLRPDDSHTLYSLAATHAQSGSADQALSYLEQAVQKQPRLRQRALQDSDFSALKEDRRFLELLGATSPFDLLEARREGP